jgi:hypothetical protein
MGRSFILIAALQPTPRKPTRRRRTTAGLQEAGTAETLQPLTHETSPLMGLTPGEFFFEV